MIYAKMLYNCLNDTMNIYMYIVINHILINKPPHTLQ